ncbi:hypothetical protein Kfla_4235 [Kribbella flavida DSM 17836]|uniref:Uncharacterized protein n=1 Tax=Kribbella flavida (strain DSM 17836 / JCM 10339 / NBRC 14399) TaxID=479435 RepID=D2PTY8_KRIFD|nr:hypothetical protein [Kribbella flavida]ADB33271.1 hypothetical protein Kfla_4235 [Kribbella flavida DSM 17836]
MAFEEKRAWVFLSVSVVGYLVYLAIVLGRIDGGRADTPYVAVMLWTIGAAIVAAIVLEVVLAATGAKEDGPQKDQRDLEIARFGEQVGQSFVVIGGLAALLLAMVEADHFWIANAIYLAFVLSAVLGSVARLFAYRRGLPW